MKYHLETDARSLRAALKTVMAVIEKRNTIPVLGMALFDGGTVFGTDLDTMISARIPAIRSEGKACISVHALARLAALIAPDQVVSLTVNDDNVATLKHLSGRYELASVDAKDFPLLTLQGKDIKTVRGFDDSFVAALRHAMLFVSTGETRYYLNGVYFDGTDGKCGIVATDGHKLGCHPVDFNMTDLCGLILHRKIAGIMCGLPAPKSARRDGANRLHFTFDGVEITTKTIDGTFPDWRRVVPKRDTQKHVVEINRAELMAALARLRAAAVSGRHGPKCVTLASENGQMIAARKIDGMSSVERLRAFPLTPEPFEISFNSDYFDTILRALGRQETVTVRMADSGSPMTIHGAKPDRFTILMPMRGDDIRSLARAELDAAAKEAQASEPLKSAA